MEHSAPPSIDISTLHRLLENVPGFIAFIDPDLTLRYHNRDPEAVVGKRVTEIVSADQIPAIVQKYEEARRTGEEQSFVSFTGTADQQRWFRSTIAPLLGDDGALVGYAAISSEVTAQRMSEQALKKAQEELLEASHRAGMAEVATGVLHSMGNTLNSVNVSAAALKDELMASCLSVLARTVELCKEQGETLAGFLTDDPRGRKVPELLDRLTTQLMEEHQRMHAEVTRLIEHVNAVRATLEAQNAVALTGAQIEPAMLGELVQRAVSMFRTDLEDWHISLHVDVADTPPVLIDRQRTLQVLVNLIRNAIEAVAGMEPQRTVRITVSTAAEQVRFEIADNGCGIPAEDLARIFRHGFTTKKEKHGFGLHSSAIAAQIMSGALSVQSQGPGQGATFCLSVPYRMARPGK